MTDARLAQIAVEVLRPVSGTGYSVTLTDGVGIGEGGAQKTTFNITQSDTVAIGWSTGVFNAVVTLTEGVGFSSAASVQMQFLPRLVDNINLSERPSYPLSETLLDTAGLSALAAAGFRKQVTDTLTLSDAPSYKFMPIPLVWEVAHFGETLTPNGRYHGALVDPAVFKDALSAALPATILQALSVTQALTLQQGVQVAEQLKMADAFATVAKMGLTVADSVKLVDSLGKFLAGAMVETIGVSLAATTLRSTTNVLSETVGMHPALTQRLVIRVVSEDGVKLAQTDVLRALYHGTLSDEVEFSAGYVSPNGGFTTWAINTRTGAMTEYGNYVFNSFAQVGHKYLGASKDGLYELDGDKDAGASIIAKIKSGYAQFGAAHLASFKAAYLGLRGGGNYIFRLETADGRTYDYSVVAQDMQTTKIRLGKGLRARYFAFELESLGDDFDLESVEFIPLVAQRRV